MIWTWEEKGTEEYLLNGPLLEESWRIISVEYSSLEFRVRLFCCCVEDILNIWPTVGHFIIGRKGNFYLLDKERMIIPKRKTFIVEIEGCGVNDPRENG